MKVLEVNDNDIYGKVFNGYTIMEELNKDKNFSVKQLVINKLSNNDNCKKLFSSDNMTNNAFYLNYFEHDILSTQSLLSLSSIALKENQYYKQSDLVHFHQVHNCGFSLPTFLELAKKKPTVISLHDFWFMTGRCVHPSDCTKWKEGCKGCESLDTIFDLPYDNCSELWKIKNEIKDTDVDVIVHSKYAYDLVKKSPHFKNLRLHEVPLGIKLSDYELKYSKEEAKEKLGIFANDTVIFFREQKNKGTDYIIKALKGLKNKSGITLLTCSEKGLINELKNDFNIVELGVIDEDFVKLCYNASDLFIMPSLGETFGFMAIEAMASGVPVIVFDNTALPSTTGAPNVGILVKNLDYADLRKKIEYYLKNTKEREERGRQSKGFVKGKYDYDTYLKKISNIYKEAYEKQKYKIRKVNKISRSVDYKDDNVKKVLTKLNIVYNEFFPNSRVPSILKKETLEGDDIEYSNKSVINVINKFNKLFYKKLSKDASLKLYNETPMWEKIRNDLSVKDDRNENPKVSIIIPVYNGANYVSLAIDSALRQTYKNIEIIVVNDGSKDNTEKVCKSYGNKIRYIKKENGGVSTALNEGIKNMTGDYFSWLSHDDLYYPEKVATEVQYLKENKLLGTKTIVYSDFSLINANGELTSDVRLDTVDLNRDSLFSIIKGGINGLTLLIPKTAFDEIGLFDPELRCVQDYKMWFDMYNGGYKFVHIPRVLACTRIHELSVTNTNPRYVVEGNKFWIDTIESISDEKKEELYGSLFNCYYSLFNYFNGGPYDKFIEYCHKKYKEILKKSIDNIDKIKVSIILSFTNHEDSVIRAINSVLNQTHKCIELIVINNGSKESTSEVEKLCEENNIKYISESEKATVAVRYNEALAIATGEYVSFMNQNSVYEITKVKEQLKIMLASNSNISHTSYLKDVNGYAELVASGFINGYVIHKVVDECTFNLSTMMIRKKLLTDNNIKFREDSVLIEDLILYLELLKDNILVGINKPLVKVYYSKNNEDKVKIKKLVGYIYNDKDCDLFIRQYVNELYRKYILFNSDEIDYYDYEHSQVLERYRYFQSKEYKYSNKIRKAFSFKKTQKAYQYELPYLKNKTLNKTLVKLRNIKNKIKK